MIVTIDGPAGSGKSTIARELAAALGIAWLDTGATYRAMTFKALRDGVDMNNHLALTKMAREVDIRLVTDDAGRLSVMLDGEDVTREIRTKEVTDNAHFIARAQGVRDVLVDLQRRIGAEMGDFVTEGRDQGSVVFPDADVKFFLDARPSIRARRRYEQMTAAGETVDYESILSDVLKRDHLDRNRPNAPLVKPAGAVVIDTSDKTIAQVTSELLEYVEDRR